MFLKVMTPLIMVISFSDSMQLTFAARDPTLRVKEIFRRFRNAMLVVGAGMRADHAPLPHCLSSPLQFRFPMSDLIRTFGEEGLSQP